MEQIDWHTGTYGTGRTSASGVRLLFAGDWAPVRRFTDTLCARPGALYGDSLKRVFADADFRIINVECVLHDTPDLWHPVPKEGPNLAGPSASVNDLKCLGTDLALLANNHIYDFGAGGLRATRDLLEKSGLRTCGSGTCQEDAYDGTVVSIGGRDVAFVNFQEGEEGPDTGRAPELAGWDLDRVRASIRAHCREGRTVIALPHADREFLPFPAPYIQAAFRSFVEAGAAAVIAHHPHVPRGVEVYRGAPIFYSLGNFAFWQEHPGIFRKIGYLVHLCIGKGGAIGWKLFAYLIRPDQIDLPSEEERKRILAHLASVSETHLSPHSVLAAWHAAIDAIPVDEWYASCTGMDYTFKCLKERDPTGLARMRTRLSSPSHYTFMKDGITRILDGQHGQSDPRLVEQIRLWTEGTGF